jgi:hypothetical protein
VIWPEKYDPKALAIHALKDIDGKAPLKWYGGCRSTPRTGRSAGRLQQLGGPLSVLTLTLVEKPQL